MFRDKNLTFKWWFLPSAKTARCMTHGRAHWPVEHLLGITKDFLGGSTEKWHKILYWIQLDNFYPWHKRKHTFFAFWKFIFSIERRMYKLESTIWTFYVWLLMCYGNWAKCGTYSGGYALISIQNNSSSRADSCVFGLLLVSEMLVLFW